MDCLKKLQNYGLKVGSVNITTTPNKKDPTIFVKNACYSVKSWPKIYWRQYILGRTYGIYSKK